MIVKEAFKNLQNFIFLYETEKFQYEIFPWFLVQSFKKLFFHFASNEKKLVYIKEKRDILEKSIFLQIT